MGSPSRSEASGGQNPIRLEAPRKGGGGVVIPVPGDASRSFRTVIQLINAAFKRIGKYIGVDGKVISKGFFGRLPVTWGPDSSTDNAVARFDGITGDIQDSVVTVDDTTGRLSILSDSTAVVKLSGDAAIWLVQSLTTTGWFEIENGGNEIVRIESGGPREAFKIDSSGQVGISTTPVAMLDVNHADSLGAVPVLRLAQGDDSEEMIEFVGTIGTGNALEAAAAKTLTTTHFIKVTIPGGLTRYIPCGTIA